jgi:hypothetical protein
LRDLEEWQGVEDSYSFGEYHHAVMKKDFTKEQLQNYLDGKGHKELHIHLAQPNIEDCFMQLMQN